MIAAYRVEIWRNGAWCTWGTYLYERMAEHVKVRREQEGLTARVVRVTID